MTLITSTVAILKPDAVKRRLVGNIVGRIESEGFSITAMRYLVPDVNFPGPGYWNPRKFYSKQHEGKDYFERLVEFMCSGPSVGLILAREDAIVQWRNIMGPYTNPLPTQIRYLMDKGAVTENLVHGCDSEESLAWELPCLAEVL